MIVNNFKELERKEVQTSEAKNAFMKVLVSEKEGWDDYVMRVVEVEEGGYTPRHQHPWPHINYIIEGQGQIMMKEVDHPVGAGSYAFVPENTLHQYRNTGKETFKFICIVPKRGHQ